MASNTVSGEDAAPEPSTSANPMRLRRQRKTCMQCAKSKRKCDQTLPWCKRCMERGTVCTYPPRRTAFTYPVDAGLNTNPTTAAYQPPSVSSPSTVDLHGSTLPPTPSSSSRAGKGNDADIEDSISPYKWFLSPHSWSHFHSCDPVITQPEVKEPVSEQSLPHYIEKQQSWLRSWVKDGHSPLMHRQLYRSTTTMPACIRSAYTARAAYDIANSASSKTTALRIMDELAQELIQSQPNTELDPSIMIQMLGTSTDPGTVPVVLDTFTHLARTQALFVYQMTRLFDGDIRARDQAEGHIDTLNRWSREMLESARLDCAAAEVTAATSALISPDDTETLLRCEREFGPGGANVCMARATRTNPFTMPHRPPEFNDISVQTRPTVWQAWIIAESVRRIYISARIVEAVYSTLKQGWTLCPGGVMFAAQAGLWDAKSECEWYMVVKKVDITSPYMLMLSLKGYTLLDRATPEDVDEFAKSIIEISAGVEKVERWEMLKGKKSGKHASSTTSSSSSLSS
ncbi:hypothetical protein QBC35DRAFT_385501 [Podospora australis]|uniref:Zn(2)-C6 fungal-type domain-containing protein n=1 Tax=Podospora australis TaxID=1536484 RepID=A0AAN7AFX8_9PEZI|nr:hypothetical protein QBC35DRAFT_385501 [Podospora australis]